MSAAAVAVPLQVGERALDWMIAHLEEFHPCAPAARHFRFGMKIYGELLLLTTFLLRDERWRHDRRTEAMAAFGRSVWPAIDPETLAHFDPQGVTGLALIEEFAQAAQGGAPVFAPALRRSLNVGLAEATDLLPANLLELAYRLERTGLTGWLPPLDRIYRQTVTALQLPLVLATNTDLYSITHTILYLTDMGHRPVTAVVPEGAPHLDGLLQALLGMTVRQGDMDLTAEVLAGWAFLGLAPGLLTTAAWNRMAARQLPDGAMPGPRFSLPLYRQLPPGESGVYQFETCYHTTLVTALAAAAWAVPS